MQVINRQNLNGNKVDWEFTPDGFLRCNTVRVLKQTVMPYRKTELDGITSEIENELGIGDTVNMYVSMDDMSNADALKSLEGAPVVIGEHNWLDPEVIKKFQVGQVSGTPRIDGEYTVCEFLITDPDAIEKITSGDMPEISAGYHAGALFENGDYDGSKYNAKQVDIRYNHIAVIPAGAGRAGTDVKILNMEETMSVKVKLALTGKFINTDEEGATAIDEESKKAQEVVGDTKTEGDKSLETTMSALEGKNGEVATLQQEIEELKGELSVYKAKLDELLSDELLEGKAAEMVEEQGEADEILENCNIKNAEGKDIEDAEEKKKIMNSIKPLHGEKLHREILNLTGIKCENLSKEGVKVAFKTQHQMIANMKSVSTKVVVGQKMVNVSKQTPGTESAGGARTARQKLGLSSK